MRKLLPPLLFLLLAAACTDGGVTANPGAVDVAVGQTATIEVTRVPPPYPFTPSRTRIDFAGTGAASAVGSIGQDEQTGQVTVQGLTPGMGSVVRTGGATVATVTVFDCTTAPTLTPPFATIEAKVNEQVFLRVKPSVDGGSFQWYSGTLGDAAHPIPYSNAAFYIDFVPRRNGSYPFWVRQTSACGTADAAVTVNVGLAHRRTISH